MRWKALFFLKRDSEEDTSETTDDEEEEVDQYGYFGFKSKRTPPVIDDMAEFEKDMFEIVDNIEFRQVLDPFQSKLKEDIRKNQLIR